VTKSTCTAATYAVQQRICPDTCSVLQLMQAGVLPAVASHPMSTDLCLHAVQVAA
jgi:hypothetical protein